MKPHSASAVVDEINATYATRFTLRRLLGGKAQRAWELEDPDGQRSVLKFNDHPVWKRQVKQFSTVAAHLRRHGYPAAHITLQGPLSGDMYFYLQPVLHGTRMDGFRDGPITSDALDLLLELLDRHEGIAPDTPQHWSVYIHGATFGGQHEWAALAAAANPAIDSVLERSAARLRRLEGVELSGDDFVTGDLGPHNTLVDSGRITGVIDLEASGRGDRVIDLALLLKWVDTELEDRIVSVAREMGRIAQFEVADTYWLLNRLNGVYASGDDLAIAHEAQLIIDRLDRQVA